MKEAKFISVASKRPRISKIVARNTLCVVADTLMTSAFFVRLRFTTVKSNDRPSLPWELLVRALDNAAMIIDSYMLALSNLRFNLQSKEISSFPCPATPVVEPYSGGIAGSINTGASSSLAR